MKLSLSCAWVAAMGISPGLMALSMVDRPVDELYRLVDVVVTAQVQRVGGECRGQDQCWGYILHIEPKSVHKGDFAHAALSAREQICSDIPLEPGREYTLFLEKAQAKLSEEVGPCRLTLPRDGAFESRSGKVYRVASYQSYATVEWQGDIYATNAVFVPDFENKMRELGAKQSAGD